MRKALRGELRDVRGEPLRECQVEMLRCAARGLTFRETANEMGIAWQTVRNNLCDAHARLGVPSTTAAVWAVRDLLEEVR
jgi:DNA-binding NarL/FixJ family response regulator